MKEKYLVIGILIMLFCMNVSGSFVRDVDIKNIPTMGFDGNTLYVGGSGPGNYTTIQDAIDDAVDGDTVFVYDDSSPYYENLIVDVSIDLIGENKDNTVIIGNEIDYVVGLIADGIDIQKFTIQHNELLEEEFMDILYICSDDNYISNLIFICKPFRDETAIMLIDASKNKISQNIIKNICYDGIKLRNSHYNEISENIINGIIWLRGYGITLIDSSNNIIKRNEIKQINQCVILLENMDQTSNNQIIQNNFLRYKIKMSGAYLYYNYNLYTGDRNNIFDENYWNRPRFFPKYILGWVDLFELGENDYNFKIRLLKFDIQPASKPYDIEV